MPNDVEFVLFVNSTIGGASAGGMPYGAPAVTLHGHSFQANFGSPNGIDPRTIFDTLLPDFVM
jgi:hypothetical protein